MNKEYLKQQNEEDSGLDISPPPLSTPNKDTQINTKFEAEEDIIHRFKKSSVKKFQKLDSIHDEKSKRVHYEIEIEEKDFRDQISEQMIRNGDSENAGLLNSKNNLRILESFGGNKSMTGKSKAGNHL